MEQTAQEKFLEFLEKYADPKWEDGYIGVVMTLPGQQQPELIVNLPESITNKVEYYRNAYSPDNTLKVNPKVKITGYAWTMDFEMLSEVLDTHIKENLI